MKQQAALDARALRIRARRDTSTLLAGSYASAFRGRGLTFEELRDYVPGDDTRWIDWNATARLGRPIIKRMREERDLLLALLIDRSSSLDFGFGAETKRDAARRIAGALATAAVLAQDRVAVATFDDSLRETLLPGSGPLQLERIFGLLERPGGGASTDASAALDWACEMLPRHSVVILVSDLLFEDPGPPLRRCAKKHELVALRISDPADRLPRRLAPVRVRTREDQRSGFWRSRHEREPMRSRNLPDRQLRAIGVDVGMISTGAYLVPSLHRFFERRARGSG